ncbi:hypothetical protein FVE85_6423 [Porphyridium purpureum]|uniref:Uncharacterized protein n=1 Tax=Porphyridium purpureum TaxID=35688 RepID=A0A5J4Z6J0_PORPP|nr:hypothetical protein FVE85_6423 [Porphyridium purpureum]|eukprot:POR3628..scf295_1
MELLGSRLSKQREPRKVIRWTWRQPRSGRFEAMKVDDDAVVPALSGIRETWDTQRRHISQSIDFSQLASLVAASESDLGMSKPEPSLAWMAKLQTARSAQDPQILIRQWKSQACMVDRGVRKSHSVNSQADFFRLPEHGNQQREQAPLCSKYSLESFSELRSLDAFLIPTPYKTTSRSTLPTIPEECEYTSDADMDEEVPEVPDAELRGEMNIFLMD